jgi:hypothetical protein
MSLDKVALRVLTHLVTEELGECVLLHPQSGCPNKACSVCMLGVNYVDGYLIPRLRHDREDNDSLKISLFWQ